MAMHHVKDDWNWLKSEIKLGIKFLRGYFKDKSDDAKKGRKVSAMEFGPYNGLKLLIATTIILIIVVSFGMYQSEKGIIFAVIIFIILYDVFFGKEWTTPFFIEMGGMLKNIVQGFFEIIKDMFSGFGGSSKKE